MGQLLSRWSSEEVTTGDDSIPTRVMLWSCPRSLSTAFTRSILELGNVEVFHEEFATAFYCGPERVNDPKFLFNLAPTHSYEAVRKRLEDDYAGKVAVFGKDFAYPLTMGHLDMLPRGFYHTFIIRDPVKLFTSLKQRFESSRMAAFLMASILSLKTAMPVPGYTYMEHRQLYDHVTSLGLPTLVIDADDLLGDPVEMMRYYCQTTGLPFKESMVNWEPKRCGQLPWHCARIFKLSNRVMHWYDGALLSSGFKKQAPRHIDVDALSSDVKEAIQVSQPHYDYLFARRVKLDNDNK